MHTLVIEDSSVHMILNSKGVVHYRNTGQCYTTLREFALFSSFIFANISIITTCTSIMVSRVVRRVLCIAICLHD